MSQLFLLMLSNESTDKCWSDSTEALKMLTLQKMWLIRRPMTLLESVSKDHWYCFGLGYWLWELTKELPDSDISVADGWIEKAHVISVVELL